MLLTRHIEADPPEITTQSATKYMSTTKDRTQDVHKIQGRNPHTVILLSRDKWMVNLGLPKPNTDTAEYVC